MVKYPTINFTINEAGIANKIVTSKNTEVVNDKVEITAKKNLSLAKFICTAIADTFCRCATFATAQGRSGGTYPLTAGVVTCCARARSIHHCFQTIALVITDRTRARNHRAIAIRIKTAHAGTSVAELVIRGGVAVIQDRHSS